LRKIFALVFAVTTTVGVIVGVAVAWTSSASDNFTASAGTLSVALDFSGGYGYIPNQVYPTNQPINVIKGRIKNNTPANPGIAVAITGGSVVVNNTSNGACNYSTITGDVVVTNGASIPPQTVGGEWYGRLTMGTGANDSCQGNTINYTLTVNVAT
jgi:hypothetical protein